jgi:hypothetical protein
MAFYAWNSLSHAVDHLHMLRSVLRDAAAIHMFAPYSVIRGALENASTAAWLLAPPQRPVRIERLLRLAAADVRAGEKAKTLVGSTGPGSEQERLDQLKRIAAAAGVDPSDAVKRVGYGDIVATAGAESGAPKGAQVNEFVWRLCSGNAHGDFWTTISATERVELTGAPAGIANMAIEASVPNLYNTTLVAYVMTKRGGELFDERRRAPY